MVEEEKGTTSEAEATTTETLDSEAALDLLLEAMGVEGEEPPAGESGGEAGEPQEPEEAASSGEAAPEQVAQEENLSGEEILRLFAQSEEAQQIAKNALSQLYYAAQRQAEEEQREQEFQQLVEEGKWEEIGRRFVQERLVDQLRQQALTEAQQATYVELYRHLFGQPELQNLSESDRVRLAPKNFPDDASYVAALTDFIAEKRSAAALEAEVEKRVQERLAAMRNEQAAARLGAPSPAAIPPASGPLGMPSPEDLIRLGWQEIIEG